MSVTSFSELKNLEALVVFIDDSKNLLTKISDSTIQNAIEKPLSMDFKGRFKEALIVYPEKSPIAKRVLLYGLGKMNMLTAHSLRTAAAQATQVLKNTGVTKNAA